MTEGGEAMRDGVDKGWPGILDQFRKAVEGRGLRRSGA